MKWLKKIRLINWHFYVDKEITIGKQTVLAGRTGSGKSTIIDALQVLFIANQKMFKFNSAAHEEAKRSFISYLRGKVGTQQRAFLREGQFTTYIMAEFYDDKKNESFVIGVVIDIDTDNTIDEEYFILGTTLDNINVLDSSNCLKNREEFRRYAKEGFERAIIEKSKSAYQKALLSRMGQLQDRFFSIFSKALSFKPIDSIRDFVYQNILEKKELQLDIMKENFEMHEKLKRELDDLGERRNLLVEIGKTYDQYKKINDTISVQEYVLAGLDYHLKKDELEELEKQLDKLKTELEKANSAKDLANEQKAVAKEKELEYHTKWVQHDIKKEKDQLESQIEDITVLIKNEKEKHKAFINRLEREYHLIKNLQAFPDNGYVSWRDAYFDKVSSASDLLAHLISHKGDGYSIVEKDFINIGETLKQVHQQLLSNKYNLESKLNDLINERSTLEEEIKNLKLSKRPYEHNLVRLKKLLEEKLIGKSDVWILCENIEIKNEKWRNAIEGYLNTQRFELIVNPETFPEALAVYEKEKFKKNIEGVRLVDTEKVIAKVMGIKENSLAEEIEAENPIILARVQYLLGNVMKAENEQQLRNYKMAVTATCMSYNQYTARQIPKKVYEIPYIGQAAIEKQLEIKENKVLQITQELMTLDALLKRVDDITNSLSEKGIQYQQLATNLNLVESINKNEAELESLIERFETLNLDEVNELEKEYKKWKAAFEQWDKEENNSIRLETEYQSELKTKFTQHYLANQKLDELKLTWDEWKITNDITLLQRAEHRLEEALNSETPLGTIRENIKTNNKSNETNKSNLFSKLTEIRWIFIKNYGLDLNHQSEGNEHFDEQLKRIENVDIPTYQEKLNVALKQSEEEFKAHFIFRLREAVESAKREFQQLNHALRNFPFHDDQYRFVIKANEKYKRFYDVITDPTIAAEDTLFDFSGDDKSTILKELFDILISGEEGQIQEFTDFRSYLDFDITITNESGQRYLSNLLNEQSGGETQTPFYISILASFYHLYRSNNSMRLVVFDEAFNKMDEERIQTSLKLIKQLNLQLIAAVPDEKMQHMAGEVDTTIIVNRHNQTCFVDTISREEALIALGKVD